MATQGVPTSQKFSMETSHFVAEFTVNTGIDAPTVVFVNQPYYYEYGYNYDISGAGDAVEIDATDSRYLKLQIRDPKLNGAKVRVEITKRNI